MVSKDPEIQEIYNKIKNYNTTEHFIECECSGVFCDNCEQLLETKRIKNNIPFTKEINTIIKNLLSIKVDLYSNPFSFNDPIKKIESTDNHKIWGDQDYHIVFINEGIRISMTKSFIEKIAILNNILLLDKGMDKPMRLDHLCYDDGNTYKGPYFYITKLPLDSLLFEKPPEGFNINRSGNTDDPLTTYFKYNNLAEAIYNCLWYK